MTSPSKRIAQLQRVLENNLIPLIDNDFVYWELPYYSNVGDPLIWRGTEDLLLKVPYKCLNRASMQTCMFPDLSEDTIILLQGGGNFGDLWRPIQDFRLRVIKHYSNNRIIILPQTIYYNSGRIARSDAVVMRQHHKLTICVRDKYSLCFLKVFGFSKQILLVPDMAFCIDMSSFPRTEPYKDNLILQRADIENNFAIDAKHYIASSSFDEQDWVTFDEKTKSPYCLFAETHDLAEVDSYAINEYMPEIIRRGMEQIDAYHHIYTTRLHGAILSLLMEKEEIVLFDNSYGKNRHFYKTWLRGINSFRLIKSPSSVNFRHACRMFKHIILSFFDRLKLEE